MNLVFKERYTITLCLVALFLGVDTPLYSQDSPTKSPKPPIVYVAGDGSGDFNCDGESDQVEINLALDFVAADSAYSTVYLKGPNTYWIDDTIYISADTTLEGDADAVIKLVDNAGWNTQYKPLIGQKGLSLALELGDPDTTTGNITIRGFEIDGNRNRQKEPSGKSYYNAIRLQNCYNITIHDMYVHDNLADAIQITYDEYALDINSQFYNNRIHADGHDAIYLRNVTNFEVHDNVLTDNRTDAGVRAQHCNHFRIYSNVVGNNPDAKFSGGAGIQIETDGTEPLDDAEIYGNYLYGHGFYYGIWLHQEDGGGALNTHRDVHIHHNVVSWYQMAGIGIFGFNNTVIENNVIEMSDKGAGIAFREGDPVNRVSGFRTIVKNNIIINNATYGLDNQKPAIHRFVSDYNCTYDNGKGPYRWAGSTTDVHVDPELASSSFDDVHEILGAAWQQAAASGDWTSDLGAHEAWMTYHLKSEAGRWNGSAWVLDSVTSPCIDGGDPHADYSGEPLPNGGRINMGAFGNTAEASKSSR